MADRFDHVEPDVAERAALSASWEDRAHAARVLAERPESSDLVDRLLLDPDRDIYQAETVRLLRELYGPDERIVLMLHKRPRATRADAATARGPGVVGRWVSRCQTRC